MMITTMMTIKTMTTMMTMTTTTTKDRVGLLPANGFWLPRQMVLLLYRESGNGKEYFPRKKKKVKEKEKKIEP